MNSLKSAYDSLHKEEGVEEKTLEKINSDTNLKYRDVAGAKPTKAILAPNWVYGTTSPRRPTSSVGSGLLLASNGHIAVPSPEVIQNYLYPISPTLQQKILKYRTNLSQLMTSSLDSSTADRPLLVLVGPSAIKNSNQIKACSQWIGTLLGKRFQYTPTQCASEVQQIFNSTYKPANLMLSMRANLSQYTTPYAEFDQIQSFAGSVSTFEVSHGMPYCRALLDDLCEICPIVGDISDTLTPQYLSDLFCYGLVSSTLIESQLHRELVSGVSFPVGFSTSDSNLSFDKLMYKHKLQSGLDAMFASTQPHQFLSVTKLGTATVVGTTGNDETFILVEVNTDLTLEDVQECIDKVYSDKPLRLHYPRIMLDVGKLSADDYDHKLDVVATLLSSSSYYKSTILGVVVDSGDDYVPTSYKSDLTQTGFAAASDDNANHDEGFEEMKRYFTRNSLGSTDTVSYDESMQESSFEYFINANKFISQLDKLKSQNSYS
ncbi:phospho-2-dehydro-3-deoxyheptonate aldolase [Yamadazyma tenuis]|uniref:3-deoxy-7-phosphoheptulonate synthase n=1 Tax=Candida tenuis (strain ATCC 10573 / BCRC 21748 / CBS 615 / JCM 9827 / NBRC 10315 / NRRL Y-1498 / VKM Y-70) TaxID=590646 RepID=G3B3I4_CANTC|nr:2-dehydro-3-deoxy phosphoheptonate aldolase [Yamadazyma tenuis ATCC 10573]XP_006686716.1 uncharacterized protein CANTEDRAFT_114218 [Yamadazyma tenuis ATCC 10573]EGV64401.1 2-dehydro-3-deoxy phosphoheptonate aldolase [Yamadazyma tenuis ATCC 10573]EGV64402.1 hypothetical protein CANTEDRAFT_114218 [Yamadazyma tenuis ATCC 10573]WEJ96181.1 phospho-2-dehydro-3-deoxyheptonate aldolase [Yamadazyma tenuis]